MKPNFKLKYILGLCFGLFLCAAFGHDTVVHSQITRAAFETALAGAPAYSDFLDAVSDGNGINFDILDSKSWMRDGSLLEDDKDADEGGKRSLNHFYDPLTGLGLSDYPGYNHPVTLGNNSFTWGSISNCPGFDFQDPFGPNIGTKNIWSWQNARSCQWLALTSTNSADRYSYMTKMFRSTGQVMHLLEDTSQPQHVRNEQHLDQFTTWLNTPWRSPIEDYGQDHWQGLNYQHSMLPWRADGFTRLEDFWNRGFYKLSFADALNADAAIDGDPQKKLGLAEFSNGNFLGDRHSYAEYFNHGDIRYYPYPSRTTGTMMSQSTETFTFKGGSQGKGFYLQKTNDGVFVTHHSRLTFWGAKFPTLMLARSTTIRDDKVLNDYHDILIPKAVAYSAGLLDYYFRGTIDVGVSNNPDGTFDLQVTNTSSQSFSGGMFYLLEETNGIRNIIQSNTLDDIGGTLPTNGTMHIPCPCVPQETKGILVYRGNIGTTDPVDADIAIAVKTFTLEPPAVSNLTWTVTQSNGIASVSGTGGTITLSADSSGDPAIPVDDPGGPVGASITTLSSDIVICSPCTVQIAYNFTITGADNTADYQFHASNNGSYYIAIDDNTSGCVITGPLPNGIHAGSCTNLLASGVHHFGVHIQAYRGVYEYTRTEVSADDPHYGDYANFPFNGYRWWQGAYVPSYISGTITVTILSQ